MMSSNPAKSMCNPGVTRFGLTPVAPAPTTVWISSMKRTIFPLESVTSLMTAFSRSSNSPRYLAPAMSEPMSRDISVLSCSEVGTSPEQIRCANPADTQYVLCVHPESRCRAPIRGSYKGFDASQNIRVDDPSHGTDVRILSAV